MCKVKGILVMPGYHVSLTREYIPGYVIELQDPIMAIARWTTLGRIALISEEGSVRARYILLLPPQPFKLQLRGALLLPLVQDLVAEVWLVEELLRPREDSHIFTL